MKPTAVDPRATTRAAAFDLWMDAPNPMVTFFKTLDVTPLVRFVKQRGMKFYPAMIWVVSRVINAHEEFKLGWDQDGNLIRWDFVSPSYAHFHPEDGNFTKLVTPYMEDLPAFHARFLEDREKYRELRGVVEGQPTNHFDVSCLPWVRYRHFDVHVFDQGDFLAPVVTWGKYEAEGGRLVMPLTMNIHHAAADGFHLSRFFTEVQELTDSLATGMK